jgi:hypothetical protein
VRPRRASAGCWPFPRKRACPVCSTSYAELDPRLFSYNSKHGWCPDCVGTGVKLTKEQRKVFDDSVRRRPQQGPRTDLCRARSRRRHRHRLPDLPGHAAERHGTRRAVRRRGGARCCRHRHHRPGAPGRHGHPPMGGHTGPDWPRPRDRPRPGARNQKPPRIPRRRSAWATSRWTAVRPRSAAARPSASAWRRSSAATCKACATCSTSPPSACTRATTGSC